MIAEQIDTLKKQYTDKYVVVDAARPELARFRDVVGQVKTVNMSGRALVEFSDYHLNIGWYDIDLDFLKVVDKPPPKPKEPEAKKEAPAAKAPAKPKAAAKAAPAAGGRKSTADILAAARGAKASGAAASPAQPQAATPAKPPATKPAPGGKLSTADILAAARGGKAAAPAKPQAVAAAPEREPEDEAATEPAAEAPTPPAAAAPAGKTSEKIDRSAMTVDEMIAWCRAHDAK